MSGNRQTRLIALVFASLSLVLALAYWFFLRTQYSVLYSGMRPADAAAVVAELDEQAIDYRLRDDGATIMVPAEEAAAVRLAFVGAEAPVKSLIGFELFNESDMGLTDFAQKINFQRALQGELSRTIMMMDGVESARVHLALPDRSLFRGKSSEAKAAVTVTAVRGKSLGEQRVAGIQRLVAAAVPDLEISQVVVLDELGRVVSASIDSEALLSPEAEERGAVQRYYRARIRSAILNVVPGLAYDLRVSALPFVDGRASPAPSGTAIRDFRLTISIATEASINAEDQALIRTAVADAVEMDESLGDQLLFEIAPAFVEPVASLGERQEVAAQNPPPALDAQLSLPAGNWLLVVGVLLGTALLVSRRARALKAGADERDDLVARIRAQLRSEEGSDVVA